MRNARPIGPLAARVLERVCVQVGHSAVIAKRIAGSHRDRPAESDGDTVRDPLEPEHGEGEVGHAATRTGVRKRTHS